MFIQKIRNGTEIRPIQMLKVRSRMAEILGSDTKVPILSPVTVLLYSVSLVELLISLKSEAHLEPSQTSMMELFAKIING